MGNSLYAYIRMHIQPYWRPRPKGVKRQDDIDDDFGLEAATGGDTERPAPEVMLNADLDTVANMKVKVNHAKKRFDDFDTLPRFPAYDEIWTYMSARRMCVLGHFNTGAGYRFKHESRSDTERKKLRHPLVAERGVETDRTHLIPFGFHGRESSRWLLISWNREMNRGEMNDFEQRARGYNAKHPIYWLTTIERHPLDDGRSEVVWKYRIYDGETRKPVMGKTFRQTAEFEWNVPTSKKS